VPSQVVDPRQEQKKRQLRRRIGRLRRRIDARLHATRRETQRLTAWQTYVRRWPAGAVIASLGAGFVLSSGISARRLSRWLGRRMIQRAADHATQQLWRELKRIWSNSTPGAATGADDDEA
jgi:hypothetical protein